MMSASRANLFGAMRPKTISLALLFRWTIACVIHRTHHTPGPALGAQPGLVTCAAVCLALPLDGVWLLVHSEDETE
eukprot:6072585-Prymnesium_polylepis.1